MPLECTSLALLDRQTAIVMCTVMCTVISINYDFVSLSWLLVQEKQNSVEDMTSRGIGYTNSCVTWRVTTQCHQLSIQTKGELNSLKLDLH